ncbi:hypothetical protein Pmani_018354 [Petrolisthes manimaculis]|uniref:Uncharacterized protein n=1 Tax=Petrolisthes manimaculis TaxID=1843537 RepID=A0AAE1PML6_9EUCA|nr:hypothetical protein Pmani_018354 [Petrolisthes manimaculis]
MLMCKILWISKSKCVYNVVCRILKQFSAPKATDSSTKTTSLTTHANTSGSSPDSHQHHHTHHHHIPSTLTARTTPKPLNNKKDDQTSDTSNESTETAIYLDNASPPPPPSLNMKAQQLHEDTTRVLLSSGAQKYKEEATHHTWQHEPLPSNENEIGTQAHQAGIMSELQNAIMQRREQTQPQIHIPEAPVVVVASITRHHPYHHQPLHHLPPTPPGSVPRRPPPTPSRLKHQHPPPSPSPATDNKLPLPTPSTPVSHHPSHLHSSRFTQTPRPVHSRQQSKIAEFRKSISRSLEDYHSHAATHQEGNQGYREHKNSAATTQKGTLHAKPTLIHSSGVSTSLPKDINWRTDTHAGHEAHILEMGRQQQQHQEARRLVHTLVDDLTPAATSSPITSRRRRTRFPDDFLWQGGSGRLCEARTEGRCEARTEGRCEARTEGRTGAMNVTPMIPPGRCMRVALTRWPPYVSGSNPNYSGWCIEMFDVIREKLGYCHEYLEPPDGLWGAKYPNGSWFGMMGMIHRREVDVAIGPFGVTLDRIAVADFSVPITATDHAILYRRPQIEPDLAGFVRPFTLPVWGLVVASLILVTGVALILHVLTPSKHQGSRGTDHQATSNDPSSSEWSWLWGYKVLLGQDVRRLGGNEGSPRVMAGLWMLVSFIMAEVYCSNLKAMLIVPKQGYCRMALARGGYMAVQHSMGFPLGSPLKLVIDDMVYRMMEFGLMNRFIQRAMTNTSYCLKPPGSEDRSGLRSLAVGDFLGMFSLYGAGVVGSLLVFTAEVILGRQGHNTNPINLTSD